MRIRRAEVSIKIRRAKKDDHLHKRRNIDSDDKLLCAQQETHDLDATCDGTSLMCSVVVGDLNLLATSAPITSSFWKTSSLWNLN